MGQMLGRLWRGCLCHERTVNNWLAAQGLPAGVAKGVSLLIKLAALGVVLYVASWLVLLLMFAAAAVWAMRNGALDSDDEESFLAEDELSKLRRTPGYDPNPYNDSAHEMYTDD
ncbi:DUF3742 family protein [Pseudomonas aeruginosa]|nr:hypothetical protein APB28_00380 [Pseudomonas aeruginosa]MCO1686934.1 DUF3742 family protein [Pseudomonas aeruginosa]MCO1780349.1 DUF3742 family protein [Pseudomonas aeruginosa]MCO1790165.1 DUF3742 family protein [Pseudomonas aeruginosa]MCO1799195.1 DUF3742 family protein [Pseudomonas aeruginosa]